MASPAEESTRAQRPHPQVVGTVFVEQYYNVLSTSPEDVHKFYQDSSAIGRPNSDGVMTSVCTLADIDKTILSVDYKKCVVEILTTDAQDSFGGGVIVLVTGFFTGKDVIRRKFAQVFFLEPQPKDNSYGYYVLNDILRYVEEEEVAPIKIDDADDTTPTTPVTPDPEPTVVFNHVSHDNDNTTMPLEEDTVQDEQSSHPLDNGNISAVDEVVSSHSISTAQNDGNPDSAGTEQSDSIPVSDVLADVQEDAPKKSYASVANLLNYKKQPFQLRSVPAKPVKQFQLPEIATTAPEVLPPPANNKSVEKNDSQVKGYSIFVANLPMNATVEQLKETFEKFGPIKPNGIQVRSYKLEKNCFGFVEFESEDSMQSALKVSSIKIGERQAHIEEKKANNEGSKFPPRKTGFRGDNFRNRRNSGGRGYGRNEFDNHGGLSGQSHGFPRHNGEANQKVHQNGGETTAWHGQGEGQSRVEGGKK